MDVDKRGVAKHVGHGTLAALMKNPRVDDPWEYHGTGKRFDAEYNLTWNLHVGAELRLEKQRSMKDYQSGQTA